MDPIEEMNRANFVLTIRLPGQIGGTCYKLDVGQPLADCMRPLPRDRELPWAAQAKFLTAEMEEGREVAAREIAEHFTAVILKAVRERDPINGYRPGEL